MTGRRQIWTGLTLFAISLAVSGLSTGLGAGATSGLADPAAGLSCLGVAALLASVLIAMHARQLTIVPRLTGGVHPPVGDDGTAPPVLLRSSHPDSAGRSRPRAPGQAPAARPA